MRAIPLHEFGGPEVLKLEEVATPADDLREYSDALRKQAAVTWAPTKMHSGNLK
jgi:hypothetical protein